MPAKNQDLHESAPDDSNVALVIVDMINDLEYPGADAVFQPALNAAKNIRELKARAKELNIPVIYANDNFGRWRSDFREVVEHCINGGVRGGPIASLLKPEDGDYFVLKPKYSAFYATTFETLLTYLGCRRIILTGIAGNMCVQFTACDAYMRDYLVHVPSDCTASNSQEDNQAALKYIGDILGLDVTDSTRLDLDALQSSRKTI
jgi:nicotinamidase-related amidase